MLSELEAVSHLIMWHDLTNDGTGNLWAKLAFIKPQESLARLEEGK